LEITNFLPYPETCKIGESLIDWAAAPDDPIFRLNLPQPGMLAPSDLARMVGLVKSGASAAHVRATANDIRRRLNPHPSGQLDLNQARLNDGAPIPGLQHKYAETFWSSLARVRHATRTVRTASVGRSLSERRI
jgi:hypothetical protein